jgi:hypothetical protein
LQHVLEERRKQAPPPSSSATVALKGGSCGEDEGEEGDGKRDRREGGEGGAVAEADKKQDEVQVNEKKRWGSDTERGRSS